MHIPIARNKKALVLVVVALFLALTAAACSQNTQEPVESSEPAAVEEVAEPAQNTPPAQEDPPAEQAAEENGSSDTGQPDPAGATQTYEAAPKMTIDTDKYYYATLKTEKGDIKVQLFADRTPITVNNFVFLAREGYYDGTTFHRVLDDFMAQGGDPSGTGAGDPGYQFQDEIVPGLVFDRPGLLAMANAGPGTNGSQFFITFAPTDWLNGRHTIFGEVIEGMEVLDELTRRDPAQNPDFEGDALETVEIEETEESVLPTPTPLPPPTPTPTPYAPSSIAPEDLTAGERPLADLPMAEKSNVFNTPPEVVIDTAKTYTATITTSQGDVVVRLEDEAAPTAVNNFVLLAALGFYDGTPINDVNEQLLIFGAPENVPTSYVGYFLSAELGADVEWDAGALGYLPAPDPVTGGIVSNGSQVLVVFEAPPPEATQQVSFFGQVVEGLDLLKSLTLEDTIESVTIETGEE